MFIIRPICGAARHSFNHKALHEIDMTIRMNRFDFPDACYPERLSAQLFSTHSEELEITHSFGAGIDTMESRTDIAPSGSDSCEPMRDLISIFK